VFRVSSRARRAPLRCRVPLGATLLVAFVVSLTACGAEQPGATGRSAPASAPGSEVATLRAARPFNIVVITLDTTRADHIGAYGSEVETPAIDALAADGIVFEQAYSPVPLTLPAHTSLFTGLYPFDHGVRDNIGFAVPDRLTTLAEVLRDNGYHTAAFVAAYVLARHWRLDQGFDLYDDGLGVEARRAEVMIDAQRAAGEVVDGALAWLDERPPGPYFLWVHLYDPHVPYTPPEPYRSRYADDPYGGEIAFMDAQIARLLNGVENGDRGRPLVVVAGDHGESLGEHGEKEHGYFLYQEATHVPLIFALPGGAFAGHRDDTPVSLIDVMPTVLDAAGIATPGESRGRSLLPLLSEPGAPPQRLVYSETYYARLHYGWSELAAVQDARYKLITSPDPELYDLTTDPDESVNLIDTQRDEYERLDDAMQQLLAAATMPDARIEVDAGAQRALEALGYIAGPAASGTARRATPRAKLEVYNKSLHARDLKARGELDEAARLYNEILDEDPEVLIAYERLGEIYMLQGRIEEAAETFSFAIPLRPDWYDTYNRLAQNLMALGRDSEAEQTLLTGLQLAPPNPVSYCMLGSLAERRADYGAAVDYYRSCQQLDSESPEPLTFLARAYLRSGDLGSAETNARAALALDPSATGPHYTLAQMYSSRGDQERAQSQYQAELRNTPDHVGAHFGLAMLYGEAGRTADEERHLEAVLQVEPDHPLAALFLANLFLARGDSYERGVELVTAAVEKPLEREDLAAGYFILSQLHERLGHAELARQYLRRAESIGRQR
jgi:arylsulfatase A-like enzyme/Tfp pilus assembly protein PilF